MQRSVFALGLCFGMIFHSLWTNQSQFTMFQGQTNQSQVTMFQGHMPIPHVGCSERTLDASVAEGEVHSMIDQSLLPHAPEAPPSFAKCDCLLVSENSSSFTFDTWKRQSRIVAACPRIRMFSASETLPFAKFIDTVFNKLELVQVNRRPFDYVLETLFDSCGSLSEGFWGEFGVFRGGTLLLAHKKLNSHSTNCRFSGTIVGFDSFAGLPEKWRAGFDAGAFGEADLYSIVRRKLPAEVELYKGWFQDSISLFLTKHPRMPAAFIHLDADLFSSTMIALSMMNNRIVPGTVLCFDELHSYPGYEKHEILALYLWMKQSAAEMCAVANYDRVDRETKGENSGKQGSCFQVLSLGQRRHGRP
jgi:hypothetical protein